MNPKVWAMQRRGRVIPIFTDGQKADAVSGNETADQLLRKIREEGQKRKVKAKA